MKNNKSLLSLGIIALVLFLGVGYAVVNTTNLTIGGTASVADSQMNVEFTKAVEGNDKVTATIGDDHLTATIAVNDLEEVGETVTATYTIKNNDTSLAATIAQKSVTVDPSGYFEVTTDLGTGKTLAAEGTLDVVVTVKLAKMPVSSDNSSANITVNLTATPIGQ